MAEQHKWMPVYIGEYLRDTGHLSTELHGAYFLLLMHYWVHGPLPDDNSLLQTLSHLQLEAWNRARPVLEKFFQIKTIDGQKYWFQKRQDSERAKAQGLVLKRQAQTENARKAKRTVTKPVTDPVTKPVNSSVTGVPPPPPYAGERGAPGGSQSCDRPSLDEVRAQSDAMGLVHWQAEDWFNEMEACGWLDYHHRPVLNWQAMLARVKTKWEADGRPMQKPGRAKTAGGNGAGPRVFPEQQLKELEALVDKHPCNPTYRGHRKDASPEEKEAYRKLRQQRDALKTQIAAGGNKK